MKSVKVFLANGKNYDTSVNPAVSNEEIKKYFVGQSFEVGREGEKEEFSKCVKVEISERIKTDASGIWAK